MSVSERLVDERKLRDLAAAVLAHCDELDGLHHIFPDWSGSGRRCATCGFIHGDRCATRQASDALREHLPIPGDNQGETT